MLQAYCRPIGAKELLLECWPLAQSRVFITCSQPRHIKTQELEFTLTAELPFTTHIWLLGTVNSTLLGLVGAFNLIIKYKYNDDHTI